MWPRMKFWSMTTCVSSILLAAFVATRASPLWASTKDFAAGLAFPGDIRVSETSVLTGCLEIAEPMVTQNPMLLRIAGLSLLAGYLMSG